MLLAFFPLAFTRVCTAEMRDFSNGFSEFEVENTTVYGISVDSTATLKEFKAKHGISIDLLSDFKREVCRKYGTLLEDEFFSNRSYFIIDEHGVVRWTFTESGIASRRENSELVYQLGNLNE